MKHDLFIHINTKWFYKLQTNILFSRQLFTISICWYHKHKLYYTMQNNIHVFIVFQWSSKLHFNMDASWQHHMQKQLKWQLFPRVPVYFIPLHLISIFTARQCASVYFDTLSPISIYFFRGISGEVACFMQWLFG